MDIGREREGCKERLISRLSEDAARLGPAGQQVPVVYSVLSTAVGAGVADLPRGITVPWSNPGDRH